MFIRIFCILAIISLANNAFAIGGCVAPEEPACAGNEQTYNNKEAYAECTQKFVEMANKVKEYVECVKTEVKRIGDEAQKDVDAASKKTNDAIQKFNCRGDSRATC